MPSTSNEWNQILQNWMSSQLEATNQLREAMTGAMIPQDMPGPSVALFRQFENNIYPAIRHFLNLPPVGLPREYLENANKTLDRMTSFNIAVLEFCHYLGIPLEESTLHFRDYMKHFMDDPQAQITDVYRNWLQDLEKRYMELYHSKGYTQVLNRLIQQTGDLRSSARESFQDLIKYLGLPLEKDMDAVCREVHKLRKQVNELQRQQQSQSSALPVSETAEATI